MPCPCRLVVNEQGCTEDFLKEGRARKFSNIVASRVQKPILRNVSKLFAMLQASSILPQSKKLKNTCNKDATHVI